MAKSLLERVRLESEYVDFVYRDGWAANQWKCTIRFAGKQWSFDYFLGTAHTGEPELKDVLYSLRMDAQAAEMGFDNFCLEFGYDNDSRKAEATWKACVRAGKAFKRVFGSVEGQLDRILENY